MALLILGDLDPYPLLNPPSPSLPTATAKSPKILHALKPIQQITVRIAGHDHIARDPITKPAQAILDALDITLD